MRTKIRERSWSEPKMTTRKRGEREEMKDKPDWVDSLEKRLITVIENQNETVLKRMAEMETRVNDKISKIQMDMKKYNDKLEKVEQKTLNLEEEVKIENMKLQDQLIVLEYKILENSIRFRGIPESEKDVREEMTDIISELIEIPPDEVDRDCEAIYRVNSDFARQKSLPRDIIVKVTSHKLRDLIFSRYYQDNLEIEGKKIRIWRELPKDMIRRRKEFKQLIDKLKQENIRFRWEIPRGLSFMYNNKKIWIKTEEQMNDFFKIAKKDQGKEGNNGN